jgi:hypothetical protein
VWRRKSLLKRNRVICPGALACLLLVTAAAMAGPESPGESAPQTPSATADTELDSVTVEAQRQRISRQVSEFVSSIAISVNHESLARWQVPVCVRSAGLTAAETEFVEKRVSQIASDAGVPLGRAWAAGLRSQFHDRRDAGTGSAAEGVVGGGPRSLQS